MEQKNIFENNMVDLREDVLTAYIAGAYDEENKLSSAGIIFFNNKAEIIAEEAYVSKKKEYKDSNDIVGEFAASAAAVEYAVKYKHKKLLIVHDLEDVSKWAKGEWKTNQKVIHDYADFIKKIQEEYGLEIQFTQLNGQKYDFNELVNRLADNVLKIYLKKEITSYNGDISNDTVNIPEIDGASTVDYFDYNDNYIDDFLKDCINPFAGETLNLYEEIKILNPFKQIDEMSDDVYFDCVEYIDVMREIDEKENNVDHETLELCANYARQELADFILKNEIFQPYVVQWEIKVIGNEDFYERFLNNKYMLDGHILLGDSELLPITIKLPSRSFTFGEDKLIIEYPKRIKSQLVKGYWKTKEKEVEIFKSWAGYDFSEQELETLLNGERISIEIKFAKKVYNVTGKLMELELPDISIVYFEVEEELPFLYERKKDSKGCFINKNVQETTVFKEKAIRLQGKSAITAQHYTRDEMYGESESTDKIYGYGMYFYEIEGMEYCDMILLEELKDEYRYINKRTKK